MPGPQYGAAVTTGRDQAGPPWTALSLERSGHVAVLFLDRPERRNALGDAFFAELPAAMAAVGGDPGVRAVVIAAKGPAFTVGLDLAAMAGVLATGGSGGGGDGSEERSDSGGAGGEGAGGRGAGASQASSASRVRRQVLRLQRSISSVAECPKPVIAAVHGYCIGGGVDLISACDLRVASADAIFSVRETRMAMVADLGTLARLPLIVPLGHVAELAYTGKDITAGRAEQIGLVNSVHADKDAALAAALSLGAEIGANSPLAVEGTKAVLSEIHRAEVEAGLHYVAAWNAGHLLSDDLDEAVAAFFERRPAHFTGR